MCATTGPLFSVPTYYKYDLAIRQDMLFTFDWSQWCPEGALHSLM